MFDPIVGICILVGYILFGCWCIYKIGKAKRSVIHRYRR